MFTSGVVRTWTITAAIVIPVVTPAKSIDSVMAINSEAKTAAQADVPSAAARADAALRKALAGTWVVTVDQPGFPLSQRYFTFNADGGLVANDDLQVGPDFVEHFTIGQGNWIRTGIDTAAATMVGQRYNLQGTFLGTYKVRMNLDVNPITSEWSGRFRIEIILANGQVVFTSDGTFEATRLAVEAF